jgi:hypothetical protein
MVKERKSAALILFLLLFLTLTLSINFLHTEKTLSFHDRCPACQFQMFSLATPTIHFFHHPGLSLLEMVAFVTDAKSERFFAIGLSPRSPPQA